MRRSTVALAIVLIALLVAAPVFAITGNFVDDDDHPFVGMVAFYDLNGEFIWRCSGSLIAPDKVLTAGHCADIAEGADSARVWFQQDAGANYDPNLGYDPDTGYPDYCAAGTLGTLCAESAALYNFDYPGGFPDTHDVGLVILAQPITMSEYGDLPEARELDSLATARGTKDTVFTVSGYGVTYSPQEQSAVPGISYRVRLMAEEALVNLRSALTDGYNLETQGNGKGRGGTCFGDSGGPVFLGGPDSNKIVAVTSFGLNGLCRGTDFSYRIDRTDVLDFINSH